MDAVFTLPNVVGVLLCLALSLIVVTFKSTLHDFLAAAVMAAVPSALLLYFVLDGRALLMHVVAQAVVLGFLSYAFFAPQHQKLTEPT